MENKKILITSALPYVNNVPHLGNIIGCVLSADVFARYNRLRNRKVLFVCGTDEYGTATQAKAIEENISPKELCDKYHKIHKKIYDWFNISFDVFGRTSDASHTKIVQEIFLDIYKNGYMVEKEIEQAYDQKHDMFLADRFIVGECPFCHSPDARADQCDVCSKLLTFSQLINPKSKLSGQTPILKTTKHLFLDLPKVQPKLKQWIEDVEKSQRWSSNTIAIAKSWLNEGLEQRSITRDLKWGIPVPLPGWENKVFYVWFDAPIGYISISATHTSDYMKWWGGNNDVLHYEFIGKDNVPFHSIIFPATLLATAKTWTLPHFISSTEFLNYENDKFSKSRGVGVFGNDAMDSQIPCDVWRYYLISNRPETSDNSFSWEDFGNRTNNELLANFGNLINRTLVFLNKNFDGIVPVADLTKDDESFLSSQRLRTIKIAQYLDEVKLRAGINEMMAFSSEANSYFQKNEPWKLLKEDKARAGTVLNVLVNQVLDLAILCEPFLPNTSKNIFEQLNIGKLKWDQLGKMGINAGHKLSTPTHLFTPIEKKRLDELKSRYGKTSNKKQTKHSLNISDLDLEVGLIQEVKRHPNADKLYIEKILMADAKIIQVCSGLVGYISQEELLGKTCIIVKNLKPAKLRGELSEGMLLAVQSEDSVEVISPSAIAGTKVKFENVVQKQKYEQIDLEEFLSVDLHAKDGIVYSDSHKMIVNDKPVMVHKISDGKVR